MLSKHPTDKDTWEMNFPTTKDVYLTRKALKGLLIGELDKNPGELSLCCPCLYKTSLDKLYNQNTGYEEVKIRKVTSYQMKKWTSNKIHEYVLQKEDPQNNQKGTLGDVIKAWKALYKSKGWSRFAKFDSKGGFNIPYSLYKAKNVIDPEVRRDKLHKTPTDRAGY